MLNMKCHYYHYFIYKGLHFVIKLTSSERKQLLCSRAILNNLLARDDRLASKMT